MPVITGVSGGSGTAAVVQFVDSIGTTPVVRFDFHDFEPSMVATIDLSGPPLRYAKSSTMLVDGERISASAYGNRTITISAEFGSTDADSAAVALSALALELDRPNNILRVQLGSVPTFFRTYRAGLPWQMVDHDSLYLNVPIVVEAEPFGLGLMEIANTSYTVPSDPADGTTPGRYLDLIDVLGDVETPAQILYQDGFSQTGTVAFGVRRRGTPSAVTHWMQAETLIAGTDTAVATAHDTDMSGAGNNYMHTTFATNVGMVNRVGFQWPAASSIDARGAYRVFARAVQRGGSSSVTVTATYNGIPTGTVASFLGVSGSEWVLDLGTVSVPQGTDPIYYGYSGTQMAVAPGPIWIQAAQAGTGTLDIDYVYLMPADDTFTAITWAAGMPAGSYAVIDAVNDSVYQILSPLTVPWAVTPSTHTYTGALPMLSPGTTRLYTLGPIAAGTFPRNDFLFASMTLQVNYWPRYLTLATP